MFGELMLHQILSNIDSTSTITIHIVEKERVTPKSTIIHCSQITSAVTQAKARNLASALEQEITVCFLVFWAIK
jgi:hypothetical protein